MSEGATPDPPLTEDQLKAIHELAVNCISSFKASLSAQMAKRLGAIVDGPDQAANVLRLHKEVWRLSLENHVKDNKIKDQELKLTKLRRLIARALDSSDAPIYFNESLLKEMEEAAVGA